MRQWVKLPGQASPPVDVLRLHLEPGAHKAMVAKLDADQFMFGCKAPTIGHELEQAVNTVAVSLTTAPAPALATWGSGVSCNECGLRDMCLPGTLDAGTCLKLDQAFRRRRPLARGEMIYIAGRPAHSVYAIRNGSVKTYAVNSDGDEIVQGFYLPGEVIGLESLSDVRHDHFAVALEPTLYCEIQASSLKSLLSDTVELRQQLMDIMNERLRSVRHDSIARARREASAQLAGFLLDLSCRNRRRGLPADYLRLSMDRRDIANFLGLSVETVSRSFTRLQQAGLLNVSGKSVRITDPRALEGLCGTSFVTSGPQVQRAIDR